MGCVQLSVPPLFMTPEAQRIAIAEACGWSEIHVTKRGHLEGERHGCNYLGVPDYLNDLNAMHEAEKVLADNEDQQYKYIAILVGKDWSESWAFADAGKAIHSTAAQRAEAFLRTLNLWTD